MSCRMPRRKTLANIKAELLEQNSGLSLGPRGTLSGFVPNPGEGCILPPPQILFPSNKRLTSCLSRKNVWIPIGSQLQFFCSTLLLLPSPANRSTDMGRRDILWARNCRWHNLWALRSPLDERQSTRAETIPKRSAVFQLGLGL